MNPSAILPFDIKRYPLEKLDQIKIGLVLSEWNHTIIDKLKSNCLKRLQQLGFSLDNVSELQVPGSFELPWGAKQFIKKGGFDAIICFGCVIKGETKHDDYINNSIARAIMTMNIAASVPVIFGVLTTNTEKQALARAGGSRGDKGVECAEAVIKMLSAKEQLSESKSKIGF